MANDLAAALPIDESMIGVLVIVLVVLLSTGYVYIQQLQTQQGAAPPAHARTHRGASPMSAARGSNHVAQNAVVTTGLTDEQLRLHRSLPSRHGARTLTICADALLAHKETEQLAWQTDDAPSVLADLLQIADVYLLCVVRDAADRAAIERIRDFVTRALASDAKTTQKRSLAPHRVLFCTTSVGKVAFVRQLEPQFHIEGAYLSRLGSLCA